MLVIQQCWSRAEFERWLTRSLAAALLPTTADGVALSRTLPGGNGACSPLGFPVGGFAARMV